MSSGSPVSNAKGTLSLILVLAVGAKQLAFIAGPPLRLMLAAVIAADLVKLTIPPLAAE